MKKYIEPICQIEDVEVCKVMALSVNDEEGYKDEEFMGGYVKADGETVYDGIW